LCVLAAGGISLDDALGSRLLDGMQVALAADSSTPNDLDSPLRLGFLNRAEGYKSNIAQHLVRCLRHVSELERLLFALQLVVQAVAGAHRVRDPKETMLFDLRQFRMFSPHRDISAVGEMVHDLINAGMAPAELQMEVERCQVDDRRMMERMVLGGPESGDVRDLLVRLTHGLASGDEGLPGRDLRRWLAHYLEYVRHEWEHRGASEGDKGDEGLFANR